MIHKLWTKNFTAIIAANTLMATAFNALIITLPPYLSGSLKMSQSSIGIIMSVFAVSALLARPVAGHLNDNYSRFPIFLTALGLMTGLYVLYPLVSSFAALIGIRLLHGAFWGASTITTSTITADIAPARRRGEGIGIYGVTVPLATGIGGLIGVQLMDRAGTQAMFIVIVLISASAWLIGYWGRLPLKPYKKKIFDFKTLLHGKALPVSLTVFLLTFVFGAVIIYGKQYAMQNNFTASGYFFLVLSAAFILSRVMLGKLFDRGKVTLLITIGLVATTAGMIGLGCAGSDAAFLASGLIMGFGFGTILPTCQAKVNHIVFPHERGAANSTYFMAYDIGMGASGLLVGVLSEHFSFSRIYLACPVMLLLAAVVFYGKAIPHYKRHAAFMKQAPMDTTVQD